MFRGLYRLGSKKNLHLDNVSIHRNFQNWFLKGNERKLDFVQFDISKAFDSIHKRMINICVFKARNSCCVQGILGLYIIIFLKNLVHKKS